MPNTQHLNLYELIAQRLFQLKAQEKLIEKKFGKLSCAAYTPELAKCLHPEQTDINAHQKRIQLILSGIKSNPTTNTHTKNKKLQVFTTKKPSLAQDILVIEQAMNVQSQKLARYELLHPIAKALKLQAEADLLEQTITDTKNTSTWLRQIIQNILVPGLDQIQKLDKKT